MMKYILFTFLLFVFFPQNLLSAENDSLKFARLLPDSLNGWQINLPDEMYDRSNLYEFIDGGAELYLSYGFNQLFHRTYHHNSQPDILVDLYNMGRGENAFGLFLHLAEKPDSSFGQGSQYFSGYLIFWKANYFISILALKETPQSKKCILDLGKFIDTHIHRQSPLPKLIYFLPHRGIIKNSLRYFHAYLWLQRTFHLPIKNIFNLDDSTKIALAKYTDSTTLAIIQYPETSQTQKVIISLKNIYFPALKNSKIIKFKNQWLMIISDNNYVILAEKKHTPKMLLKYKKVKYKLPKH